MDFSSSDEDEDQEEESDKEELIKLGLQAATRMDPATLKSEVVKFFDFEGPPSPEKEVLMQLRLRLPFNFWAHSWAKCFLLWAVPNAPNVFGSGTVERVVLPELDVLLAFVWPTLQFPAISRVGF